MRDLARTRSPSRTFLSLWVLCSSILNRRSALSQFVQIAENASFGGDRGKNCILRESHKEQVLHTYLVMTGGFHMTERTCGTSLGGAELLCLRRLGMALIWMRRSRLYSMQ